LFDYKIGAIAAGRLISTLCGECHVNDAESVIVVPFGQTATIDVIIEGIHPRLRSKLGHKVDQLLGSSANSKKDLAGVGAIKEIVQKEVKDRNNSIMSAVDALPRQDLARMADALVSLTAFLKLMTADEPETVGGAIDVALLSKGEGFVWIKHKTPSYVGI
jgi:hypothetical protein